MPDFRVFFPPQNTLPSEIRLSREESHHLVVVNRARVGDPVVAFNGRGTEWSCQLAEASKAGAVLRILSSRTAEPLGFRIMLGQSLPKGPTMDTIVRQATEVGAFAIAPLSSERSQVHLEGERQDKKLEKWQVTALEAAKQCGNPWLPDVLPIMDFASFVKGSGQVELKVIASLHPGALSISDVLDAHRATSGRLPQTVLCLIGPEGDFSPSEVELAVQHGFRPITLGPLVLRCDTAAIYALSVFSNELSGSSE